MIYDYVIVGAGMTGLYLAYRLFEKNITNFIILDKNNYIGGRALQVHFHNTDVQMGAGIVTWHNKNLLDLIKELNLKYIKFESEYKLVMDNMSNEEEKKEKAWYNNIIKDIDEYLKKNQDIEDTTCMRFIEKRYSRKTLKKMIKYAEYIEYFPASLKKTFKDYPVEDLYLSKSEIGFIKGGWKKLIEKLTEKITDKILLNTEVKEVSYDEKSGIYGIKSNDKTFEGNKFVLATDISLKQIKFNNIKLPDIIEKVRSVPYFRLYTKHDEHNIKSNLLFFNMFRKIIPINKNILMTAYADTLFADKAKEYLQEDNEEKKIEKINKNIKNMVGDKYIISPIKDKSEYIEKYWKNGVHYFLPNYNFDKTYYSTTDKKFMICGEILSKPQGNVEACIRSINDMILDKII
jgi:hypothetical protein